MELAGIEPAASLFRRAVLQAGSTRSPDGEDGSRTRSLWVAIQERCTDSIPENAF